MFRVFGHEERPVTASEAVVREGMKRDRRIARIGGRMAYAARKRTFLIS